MGSNSETYLHLLDVLRCQEKVILKQKETIISLVSENVEQENMINVLMQDRVDAE